MGTTSFLDIISSMATFGLLMLAVLRLNGSASESSFAYNQNYLLQRNMIVLTVMLEQDLNHVGACAGLSYGGIERADTNQLQFIGDVNNDGVADNVEWRLGSPAELLATQNAKDCYIYRTVNGNVTRMNLGVTQFTFRYWNIADPTDSVVPCPILKPVPGVGGFSTGNIGPVEVSIMLESPYKLNREYTQQTDTAAYQMVWRQLRSVSRNNSVQFQ